MTSRATLADAGDLTDSGYPVFPCLDNKQPAVKNGFKAATLNPASIWTADATLIGVPTGEASGFDVLDIDVGKGGDVWLAENAHKLPATRWYATRSGGRHMMFRHHPGVRNSASRIAPGVDVRGEGGYIIWWPAAGMEHHPHKIADWPEALLQPGLVLPKAKPETSAGFAGQPATFETNDIPASVAGLLARVNNAEDGEKHQTLRNESRLFGGILHATSHTLEAAHAMLMDALPSNVEDYENAAATVRWGLKQGRQKPMRIIAPSAGEEFIGSPLPEGCAGVSKPLIRIRADNESEQIDLAESAIIAADRGLYQRGSEIVRVAPVATRTQGGDALDVQRLVTVGDIYLRAEMDSAATWRKWDVRSKTYVAARCPLTVPQTYLAREGHSWRLAPLTGMIHAPTLRPDGSIITAPGYDQETGLLFDPVGAVFPPILAEPTRTDADAALSDLDGLVEHFPFVSPADRSAALSAMLTGVARASMATAPMHAFTATEPGTGKSKLATIAALIATGRAAPAANYTESTEEVRKAVDAAIVGGSPVFCLDNIDSELKGARLCTVLTEDVVSVRMLGQTKNVEMQSKVFFLATGNGMTVADDMTRRVVLCRLDAGTERPELRVFSFDPVERARANRGRYVSAALTVLRAYQVAGRPNRPTPLGSFEQWSNVVRGALIWLGKADPVETQHSARANDPRRNERRAVLHQWHATLGGERVSTNSLINRAAAVGDFREALLAVAGVSGNINTMRLGKWLSANKGRIVDGMRIEPGGVVSGLSTWQVVSA